MSNIILAIKTHFANEIYEGRKTVELRANVSIVPKGDETVRAYLYETSPVKAITGYVTLSKPSELDLHADSADVKLHEILSSVCATEEEVRRYLGAHVGFLYPISDVVMLDHPITSVMLKGHGILTPQGYTRLNTETEGRLLTLKKKVSE